MNPPIGDKINEMLKVRGITKAELARLTGISTGHISDLCNNKKPSVTVETLTRIARALRIHPGYFLDEEALTISDVLPHLAEEEREFVLNKNNLPYLRLSYEIKGKGIKEKVEQFMRLLSK